MKLGNIVQKAGRIAVVGALFAVSMFSTFEAFAQGGITPQQPISSGSINTVINNVVNWVLGLLLVVAVLYILWAAFLFLQSGGKEEDITKAKKYIQYAIIAIVVAALAKAIVEIIKALLGVNSVQPPGGGGNQGPAV